MPNTVPIWPLPPHSHWELDRWRGCWKCLPYRRTDLSSNLGNCRQSWTCHSSICNCSHSSPTDTWEVEIGESLPADEPASGWIQRKTQGGPVSNKVERDDLQLIVLCLPFMQYRAHTCIHTHECKHLHSHRWMHTHMLPHILYIQTSIQYFKTC